MDLVRIYCLAIEFLCYLCDTHVSKFILVEHVLTCGTIFQLGVGCLSFDL